MELKDASLQDATLQQQYKSSKYMYVCIYLLLHEQPGDTCSTAQINRPCVLQVPDCPLQPDQAGLEFNEVARHCGVCVCVCARAEVWF